MARETAGDYLQTKQAMELGKQFTKMDTELMRSGWAAMSNSEKDAFKIGMGKALRDTIDTIGDGSNPYNKIFKTPAMRNRLQAVLSPSEYKALEKTMEAENRLFTMRNDILGGSPTTSKAVAAAKVAANGLDAADAASGGVMSASRIAFRAAIKKAFDGINDDTASALAGMIFEAKPAEKLLMLEKAVSKKGITPAQKRVIKEAFFALDKEVKSRIAGAATAGATTGAMLDK
jgi:hypothetical protein